MDDNKLIKVRNRNNGSTGYELRDSHVVRKFEAGQTKELTFGELRELSYIPGGEYIIKNLLVIEDAEALQALNLDNVEPEYFYDEAKIRELLFNGTLEEFLDFLDFSPEGGLEIAKQIAVNEEVPDTRKREALSEKTGFNIDAAISLNKQLDVEEEEEAKETKKERRVAVKEKKATDTGRRTAAPSAPQYKVVKK